MGGRVSDSIRGSEVDGPSIAGGASSAIFEAIRIAPSTVTFAIPPSERAKGVSRER
jgi:hypothetical protein